MERDCTKNNLMRRIMRRVLSALLLLVLGFYGAAAAPEPDEAINAWLAAWRSGAAPSAEVVETLKHQPEYAVARLVGLLDGTALETAEFALEALEHLLEGRALAPLLAKGLQSDDAAVRAAAARAIGVLYREGLASELLKYLQYERAYSPRETLDLGRRIRSVLEPQDVSAEDAVVALSGALTDPETAVRRNAAIALTAMLRRGGLESVVIDALRKRCVPMGEVAAWAVQSVGIEEVNTALAWLAVLKDAHGGDAGVVPALLVWSAHPVLQVAWRAADLAAGLADSLTAHLEAGLAADRSADRNEDGASRPEDLAGDLATAHISGRPDDRAAYPADTSPVAALLLRGLQDERAVVRWAAAEALAQITSGLASTVSTRLGGLQLATDQVVAALAARIDDADVAVRRAALAALERWAPQGVPAAADRLAAIGRNAEEPEDVRAAALRLLARSHAAALSAAERELAAMYQLRPVFSRGDDGYHTFRIPALIVSPKGTLLLFAEGRKYSQSDTGDIDLVLKRSFDNGLTWEPLQIVWDSGPNTSGNPVAVVDEATGRIWLFMTHNLGVDTQAAIQSGTSQGVRTIWATYSDDDGATWAEPINLSKDVQRPGTRWDATGPGVGIQLRHGPNEGRLVIPAIGRIIYSDDHGLTWHEGGRVEGTSESQVVELTDGRLMRIDRPVARTVPNRQAVSISEDQGLTWGPVRYARELITTYVQASVVRYRPADVVSDRTLLFANPATDVNVDQVTGAKGHGARVNMTVRVSRDDGATWTAAKSIHRGPSGYSSLAVLPDGTIGLAFEGGRAHTYEHIFFTRFTLEWLEDER